MTKALVIIDVQKAMFRIPGFRLHDGEGTVARIAGLLERAREAQAPVFFVQHDGGPEDPFHPGKPGFPFHDALAPRAGEDVTVKHRGSAFHGTDFDAKLKAAGIDTLVVCGMQSEYCVDSAVRGAVERGYKVVLVGDGHTTGDSPVLTGAQIVAHANETLGGSYAQVLPAATAAFAG
ncbi:MAG TPA: cysteine hydrolase family protein [Rhizomicrobium sp.]|nr:cysteine hydrolase family protein [Rhizomicrobium sp.]